MNQKREGGDDDLGGICIRSGKEGGRDRGLQLHYAVIGANV